MKCPTVSLNLFGISGCHVRGLVRYALLVLDTFLFGVLNRMVILVGEV